MTDLRCSCGHKLAEYSDNEIRIMDKKCKKVTVLRVIDGKLTLMECNGKFKIAPSQCKYYYKCLVFYGKCKMDHDLT
jgi:hypothetical protein